MRFRTIVSGPTCCFAGFASLVALRDVWWELSLSKTESYASFAFLVSATIASLAFLNIAAHGGLADLSRKLRNPQLLWKVFLFGALSGGLYGTGFFLVAEMGAGLFNMVDYGLTPIATVLVGMLFFQGRFRPQMAVAIVVYLTGMALLTSTMNMKGIGMVGFAMLIPFITASTDGLMKWLLDETKGNLSRSELLFVRFLPATLVLGTYATVFDGGLAIHAPVEALSAAVICGFMPLWLLCTGLGRSSLAKLASWEFIIPGLAFFGTLPARMGQNGSPLPIMGALLVLSGIAVSETKWAHSLVDKLGSHLRLQSHRLARQSG